MNERITENIVREYFNKLNYYDSDIITVEEQKSSIQEIKTLLKNASKSGRGGIGSPEFIVSTHDTPDFLVVFECKANTKYHESENVDQPKDYAVDGVLHYANFLSKSYNVIAVAVSGQSDSELKISTYIHPKGSLDAKPLTNKTGKKIESILTLDDYIEHGTFDPEVAKKRHEDLMAFSRELHDFMRDHAKVTESEKPLLVSGTLIALRNKAFAKSFDAHSPADLQKEWMKVIKEEFKKADIPNSKEYSMTQPYSSIAVHPELGKPTKKYPRGVLFEIIKMLNDKVWPFISVYNDFDVVGQFYGEFLKYTGGDKKALGIVLTPRHISEFFAHIANVKKESRVLDICAGTGGFLIASMHHMFKQTVTAQEREEIKKNGLVGIEQQPNMYALGASNMILRGDGKANLHQGSCFDEGIVEAVKKHRCDIGMVNPPYSQNDEDLHELVFVRQMLDCLTKNGTGIAIVPMSCAISSHPLREELLKHHTLDAVMSMPDDLFYPVGTVTCIMVFKAHVPHKESRTKTWFGYFKNDGFYKTKHLGRVDIRHTWSDIRDSWISSYRNRDDVAGLSVKEHVTSDDEWCAEAFMKTDYTRLNLSDFQSVIKNYASFLINEDPNVDLNFLENYVNLLKKKSAGKVEIDISKWKKFTFDEIFELKKGKRLTKANMKDGSTPYIGAIDSNNGYRQRIDAEPIHEGNTISVNYNGSVGEAYYQPIPYWATDDVNVLYPKFKMNQYSGLFICAVIMQEKYRFNYGRKWHLERMRKSEISLPVNSTGELDLDFMENLIKNTIYTTDNL